MRSPCCLWVCEYPPPPINFWMPEPIFMKLGMYIMASEPISTECFINPSHHSVCLCVFPCIVASQRLGWHVPVATNTCNNRRIVGGVISYTVRVISKQSLCIPLSLLSNGSANTFPRQRRILGGVIFHTVRVVSKESRQWVLEPLIW
jgi:hypothetical protein